MPVFDCEHPISSGDGSPGSGADLPWNRYPRPQMVRREWLCLNGSWTLTDAAGGSRPVTVPFCPESRLSGVTDPPPPGTEMTYERTFTIPEEWKDRWILLHFGAVSRDASVFINGRLTARHSNGYLPFSVRNMMYHLNHSENTLQVRVVNDLSPEHAWGKQSKRRGGMWYTPCSGIWQTVWMEPVPKVYIDDIIAVPDPDLTGVTIHLRYGGAATPLSDGLPVLSLRQDGKPEGEVILHGPGSPAADGGWPDGRSEDGASPADQIYPIVRGSAHIPLTDPQLWTPEHPYLYHFTVRAGEDCVKSYFALRTLSVQTVKGIPRLCLNGKPYFFHGLLDQGYWADGLYTPPTPDGFEQDILAMKALGFNTLRKHIKIEPEQFYYDCDRLGMIVFQDMVNSGVYRYIRDTVLPTLGFDRRSDRVRRSGKGLSPKTHLNFLYDMECTVHLLSRHPCICLWTIFNEGWGQFEADQAYQKLKRIDATRFIDATSGWFHQKETDVDSLHIYFGKLHLGKESRPQILSEFGGYALHIPEHSFNPEKCYGYKKYTDAAAFIRDLRALYTDQILPLIPKGLCAAIYTQVSDVEDETNGLLTFDRQICKAAPEDLVGLSDRMQELIS